MEPIYSDFSKREKEEEALALICKHSYGCCTYCAIKNECNADRFFCARCGDEQVFDNIDAITVTFACDFQCCSTCGVYQ